MLEHGEDSSSCFQDPTQRLSGPGSKRIADVASIDQFPAWPCCLWDWPDDWLIDWQASWWWLSSKQDIFFFFLTRPGLFCILLLNLLPLTLQNNVVIHFVRYYPLGPSGLQRTKSILVFATWQSWEESYNMFALKCGSLCLKNKTRSPRYLHRHKLNIQRHVICLSYVHALPLCNSQAA